LGYQRDSRLVLRLAPPARAAAHPGRGPAERSAGVHRDRALGLGRADHLGFGPALPAGRNKILIGDLDFPTLGHQWLSRPDFEVEFVPSEDGMTIPPEAFAERIDERTALVATTHLFYTTGYLQDVRAIADAAHSAGALCLIDGYQTCGCVPIDVDAMGCDAFVGGCLNGCRAGRAPPSCT